MSSKQADAVAGAEALVGRISEHLGKLQGDPNSRDANHWKTEVNAWKDKISNLTKRMKGKTAEKWKEYVDEVEQALDELDQ